MKSKSILAILILPTIASAGAPGKYVSCDDSKSQMIRIPASKVTTLNFPTAPKEAIPGQAGFDIKRIQQDLVIKALKLGAKTNLVVYLEGRRCFFQLIAGPTGEESVFVRDPKEKTVEVKFVN